jgi:hypothetical protein
MNRIKSLEIILALTVFVVFLTLKLAGVIVWSWFWVTSPIWIIIGFLLTFYIFIGFIIFLGEFLKRKKRNK